jgi:RNA polymerase sigma-70 factor (ECF subfamily)
MTATASILEEMPLALADLYEQHHRMVFSTAYRITGNVADAEDVLHTVFVRLLRRGETDLIGNAEGYLRRAASNAALDILRARRETVAPDAERLAGTGPDPERGDLGEHLRRAIAALPERPAEMFTLRFFEGLSNREIARQMGLSPMVVAVTLHRTRKRLQKELAEWR